MLAHLAAVTTRIRLGVGVYLLPLRHPIFVAKALATLDVISDGRIDVAMGLGWIPEEYHWTGFDWGTRGARMTESLRALRELLESEYPEFHGDMFDFGPMGFEPKPRQRPMPIHIGGGPGPAVRRAARYGDGWYGPPSVMPDLRAELAKVGRSAERFQFSTYSEDAPSIAYTSWPILASTE